MTFAESKNRIITEAENMAVEYALTSASANDLRAQLDAARARIAELEKPPMPPLSEPALPTTAKTIVIRPDHIAEDWARVKTASNVTALFEYADYVLPHSLEIYGSDVVVAGVDGAVPVLIANGSIATHFSIGKSAKHVIVDGLKLFSHDPANQWPDGFRISGDGVTIRNVLLNNVGYAFNFAAGDAKNVLVEDCGNTVEASIYNYFAYPKGQNITFRRCVAHRPLSGFLRTNECAGLTIEDCESHGGESDGKVSFRVGRVLLQSVSDVTIKNLKIHKSFFGTGPLWNIDGWNQRPSDADFFARRTKNLGVSGLSVDGGGWVELGWGTENARINTATLMLPKWPAPKAGLPADVLAKLTPPKEIWVNGVKAK